MQVLHHLQSLSCPPKSLSNVSSPTLCSLLPLYFHPRTPPVLCLLSLPHHPVKHLSYQFCSLPPIHSLLHGLWVLAGPLCCRAWIDTRSNCLTQNQVTTHQQLCSIYPCRFYSLQQARKNPSSPTLHTEAETSHMLQNKTLHRLVSAK